jgi:hypothetical protein
VSTTAITIVEKLQQELLSPESGYELKRQELRKQAGPILEHSKTLTAVTPETHSSVVEIGRLLQGLENETCNFFKPIKQQFDTAKKVILEQEKADVNPIAEEKRRLSQLLVAHEAEQSRRQREAAERAKAAIHDDDGELGEPMIEQRSTPLKAEGMTGRERYVATVVDLMTLLKAIVKKGSKVPIECVEPNMKFLSNQATQFREGLGYPGVKVDKVKGVSFRS